MDLGCLYHHLLEDVSSATDALYGVFFFWGWMILFYIVEVSTYTCSRSYLFSHFVLNYEISLSLFFFHSTAFFML
jgi:hypothetical protein